MAAYNKFETFVGDLGAGTHDLDADAVEIYFSNAAPSASADSVKADLAEIADGNGYTAGGLDVTFAYSEASGTGTATAVDNVTTASGGAVAQFQYVVLFNDTPSSPLDPLIGWWDHGSAVDLADGESFTVDFGASVFTIA